MTQLRTLGSRLLNIHGQHDGQQLLDEEQHLLYLDSFGRTEGLLTEYREKYQAMAALRRQMQALEMDEAEKARRVDTPDLSAPGAGAGQAASRRGAGAAKPPDTAAQCGKIHFRCIRGGFLPQRR